MTRPLPLDSEQVFAVVSTLATETGNAIHVGLAVNDWSTFVAPTGVTDAELRGSANAYAATVKTAGKFLVHYFTRDCSRLKDLLGDRLEQDCTSITTEMVPPKGDTSTPGDPALKGAFPLLILAYIEPEPHTGQTPPSC